MEKGLVVLATYQLIVNHQCEATVKQANAVLEWIIQEYFR